VTMVRNQFFQAMSYDVAHNFIEFLDLQMKRRQYPEIFNVRSSKKAYEDAVHYTGFGPAQPKTEGEAVVYDNLIQGGSRRYVHQTWALGERLSYELMEDDQIGIMEQSTKSLVQSHYFSQEQTAANVINLGYVSTGTITDDGVSLFNNQHPLLGGLTATNIAPGVGLYSTASGTYPNRPSPDADLSFTALEYATTLLQRTPNARGIPIQTRPENLLIAPELRFIATELLSSAGKPYTSDNENNALLGENLQYRTWTYLTSPSAWQLLAPKSEHRLMWYDRDQIWGDYDRDFDTQALKFIAISRYSAGADTWLNTFGSLGP
jgi:hypothetical protein